ncbi:FAHD1 [Cordylochernes scorpioides]|uniref:oxaloacetate tautomerase n=1 Tax=Cordylochernes scorpioides TaxID=51811 RepID=A0ABY6L269_9ARAC|nr:FAHD1 [Cordylochernes scorpioides]
MKELLRRYSPIPKGCAELHHEVELGVVIARKGAHIPVNTAMDYVGGYALCLDMTARDFQAEAKRNGEPWCIAKGFDTSCPVGAFIPKEEVADPHQLPLWCKVNGVLRQDGTTADMVFKIPHLISIISEYISLEPGDLILTGTPGGVSSVKAGDKIEAGLADYDQISFSVDTKPEDTEEKNTNEDFRKAPTRIKDLEQNWISFKNTIIKAAKVSIPRGNSYQISSKIKFEIKDKKVEKKARKIIHDCKNFTSTHNIFHEKINMKELYYALENTDPNKTPGPDGIHGQMISNLGKNGKEILLDIFNNSWKTGKLPQDWKTATIIPIKKLDKSADDPKNYRPISLTSICCKLMEKIILRRLTYHLDTRNLLPEEQYGFRKGHGTIDQLLFFTQKVKDAQNRKPTNHTLAAFLDLTQAFDKVWKNKLITKLYKHFKIYGKSITWINDFLKNRYIRVKYNGTLSKTFKLYQGLPQGSVLSPTLFTLFIAGIEEKILHKTNIGLFADDIILWSSNTNWKKAERDLNKTLLHLEKFANKHKLEFNPQKI